MKKKVEEEKEGDVKSVFDLYFQRIGKPIPILPADHHFPVDSLPSQPLSFSLPHRLLFLAHASSGFCVARTTDVMDAVKAQGGGRSVRDVCLADVAVASGVRILSVSHDGSTLAAASFSHIVHFFSVPSLLDEDETPFFTCSIDPLSTIKSLEWRKMTSHLSFLLLSHHELAIAAHRKNVDGHIVYLGWSEINNNREVVSLEIERDSLLPRIELQGNDDDNLVLGLCIDEVSLYGNVTVLVTCNHPRVERGYIRLDLLPSCVLLCVTLEGKLVMFNVR